MFRTEELVKTFGDGPQRVEALKGITLEVPEGEVFGIVGHSGAGKSTLIRCLNLLERPTSGRVFLDDTELTGLSAGELRRRRQRIGMIFQHFHLLDSAPCSTTSRSRWRSGAFDKARREKRAWKFLEIVGLVDRAKEHPSRLSGGMKQRVGIARALAGSPRVLLCDEATSALDTRTAHQTALPRRQPGVWRHRRADHPRHGQGRCARPRLGGTARGRADRRVRLGRPTSASTRGRLWVACCCRCARCRRATGAAACC